MNSQNKRKPKSYFERYLSSPEWLIIENNYDPDFRDVNASQFALSNGYMGSRGIYEEIPSNTKSGTFFAGIYDPTASRVSELVNFPNPFNIYISVNKEKLNIDTMNVKEHKRILDLKNGLLYRRTLYGNVDKELIDYESMRFVSMHDENIAIMQFALRPLNKAMRFTIYSTLDVCAFNHTSLNEGNTRHFYVYDTTKIGNIHFTAVKTLAHGVTVCYAEQLYIQDKKTIKPISKVIEIDVSPKKQIIITKLVTFLTSREVPDFLSLKRKTVQLNRKVKKAGFLKTYQDHIRSFEEKWRHYDIKVVGDPITQSTLRFNIYHLICAASSKIKDTSIGVRGLTGEGYRGHIFWETELYLLPCYLHIDPIIARNLLAYRFHRLEKARQIAKSKKYEGAMYPWESADTGVEETPQWSKDFDGRIKFIVTGELSQHITADIFYAIYHYYKTTDDIDFMIQMGLEMTIEIARFWKSRLEYNKSKDCYEINNVIGPDEFHENVKNNFYTNLLVKWTLAKACDLLEMLENKISQEVLKTFKKMRLTLKERQTWKERSAKIFLPIEGDMIEEFEGYFQLKKGKLPPLDNFGIPNFPTDVSIKDLCLTQFVKQADVVMSMFLLPQFFTRNQAYKNFIFYNERTLHKSSLSFPMYCLVAAQLGLRDIAQHYLNLVLNSDKDNISRNTQDGMHTATMGGSWMCMVFGLGGIRVLNDVLVITPDLLPLWKKMSFEFFYLNYVIHFAITPKKVILSFKDKENIQWLTKQKHREKKEFITVLFEDAQQICYPNKVYTFSLKKHYSLYDAEGAHILANGT